MPYDCRDIQTILDSESTHQIDEAGFLAHVETCLDCRKLAELDGLLDDALRTSLPHPAPAGMTDAVMMAVRQESSQPETNGIWVKVSYALSPLMVILAAAVAYFNRETLGSVLTASKDGVAGLTSWLGAVNIPWGQISAEFIKAAGSTIVLGALLAGISLIWIYSITQLREITK